MTAPDIQQAREWAKKYQRHNVIGPENELAAVKVIQSLPDTVVDGDKLRQVIDFQGTSISGYARKDLESLIPAPSPRTLADMPLGELKTYVGGEVTVDGWANPTMLVAVIGDEGAVLAHRLNKPWPFVEVRPLSDLAPVAAPEQKAENTPEPVQPRPEDVPSGEAWLIAYEGGFHTALKADDGDDGEPWIVSFTPGGAFLWLSDRDVTLISRLVPESKENA